ncbi:hypothetical protein L916_18826 [Phytophthora nicotianae]|uniref:Uncharacterized protein n=1 Tax=Phytophthora nicotianae TaxID=4792 RepID=W2I0I8_PHYNI|nr:hypothetical protein L916_18826 [Phytophthora nicotianae]
MSRSLFLQVVETVGQYDSYFTWKRTLLKKCIHPTIKVAAAL